jgi:transcriptional regulator with XRE-family HTH domain
LAALTIQMPAMTISDDERTFFAGLGERVAQLRKARSITQVQLAQALGVSQQTVQAYEVGRRRIPVSTLRLLARTLDVSLDELMAEGEHAPRKRGAGAAGSAAAGAYQCAPEAQAAGGDGCDRGLARAAGPLKKGTAMNAVVFEHVPVAELPEKWRARLSQAGSATVTVRIEEEPQAAPAEEFVTDDPLFGMWRDREDMADVAGYVRKLRASRFNDDGSRRDT